MSTTHITFDSKNPDSYTIETDGSKITVSHSGPTVIKNGNTTISVGQGIGIIPPGANVTMTFK